MTTADYESHFKQALAAHQAGRLKEAADDYRKILESCPQYIPAWVNLGQILRRQGNAEQAIGCYRQAIEHGAKDSAMFFNSANALRDIRRWPEALDHYDLALQGAPDLAPAHCGRGIVLRQLGRETEALAALQEAVRLNSKLWRAWNEIGEILSAAGRRAEAANAYKRALALNPESLTLLTKVAELDWAAHRPAQAIAKLRRAAALYSKRADTHINLAVCLSEAWQLDEALALCEKALAIDPTAAGALLTTGKVQIYRGEIATGIEYIDRALALKDSDEARRSLAFASLYDTRLSAEQTSRIQQHAVRDWPVAPRLAGTGKHVCSPDSRLTLVYLSPDLHGDHPVAQFMAPVLAAHNSEFFRIVIVHAHSGEDDVSRKLATHADQWLNIVTLNDAEAAARIRDLSADIVIDLAGHTAHSRLKVLGHRPAPVQISFLGYPYTTGYECVDYLIADPVVCPEECEALYSERLLRLPHCIFCLPDLGELPAAEYRLDGGVIFGNFGNLSKLSDRCLELWVRVLRSVPNSRLLLKAGGLADGGTRRRIAERFAERGIASECLILRGPSPFKEMLNEYRDVDIILDSTPYNGGTTSFHALAMGVPLVTLPGRTFYSRMGASILSALGRKEWIAESAADFTDLAVNLAAQVDALRAGRTALRRQVLTSQLANHRAYVAALEQLLISVAS